MLECHLSATWVLIVIMYLKDDSVDHHSFRDSLLYSEFIYLLLLLMSFILPREYII